MWRGPDRRRSSRLAVACPVTVRRASPVSVYASVTQNLGPAGLCCHLPKVLERDLAVLLTIELGDGGPPVECRGTVTWSIPRQGHEEKVPVAETGIRLEGVTRRDQGRLAKQPASQRASFSHGV